MKTEDRIQYIINWIKDYSLTINNQPTTLVVGVSGGIDSAVTSTLCAKTNLNTIVVSMPIKQNSNQHSLSLRHIDWLTKNYKNIKGYTINLDQTFNSFQNTMKEFNDELAYANTRSRLRMVTLYQIAQYNRGIVVGTGNKVEDFGIGFYTKYGDGGVDISPIADCKKTQVWKMGEHLGILKEIIKADPTDGLWEDGRPDVAQIGISYQDLEKAMEDTQDKNHKKYLEIRKINLHKMQPIPVCKMDD